MYSYKKSSLAFLFAFSIMVTPEAHAVSHGLEVLAVPTITGAISGIVYALMLERSLFGLVFSKIFFSRCKDRIFAGLDKDCCYKTEYAPSGISVTCESKTVGSLQRSTYIFNISDDSDVESSKHAAISDFDDLVTMATMLAVMLVRGH